MIYIIMIGVGYIISLIAYKIGTRRKFSRNRINYGDKNPYHTYVPRRRRSRPVSRSQTQDMMDYNNQLWHQRQQLQNDQMMNYMMWQNMNNMEK